MDDAPWFDAPDLFDQERIRLGDIDGSGITDISTSGPPRLPSISTSRATAGQPRA